MEPDEIRRLIEDGLDCVHVEVTGDGRHFNAVAASARRSRASRRSASTGSSTEPSGIVSTTTPSTRSHCARTRRSDGSGSAGDARERRRFLRIGASGRSLLMDKLIINGGVPLEGEIPHLRGEERGIADPRRDPARGRPGQGWKHPPPARHHHHHGAARPHGRGAGGRRAHEHRGRLRDDPRPVRSVRAGQVDAGVHPGPRAHARALRQGGRLPARRLRDRGRVPSTCTSKG